MDGTLTIYTKERGRQEHGCADCYWSGGTQVCGYYTEPNCDGRRIYYDGHPAIDYAFPLTTPIAAAAPGTAYRRTILGSAVVIDHGSGYWSKYGHVDPGSRIADGIQVERGQSIAMSSNTGTGAAHLHFEVRYLGEYGDVVDPYGWWGEWYEDPWNRPWGHTHDWWRSRDPIPMGYRDQNGVTYGPFQLKCNLSRKQPRCGFAHLSSVTKRLHVDSGYPAGSSGDDRSLCRSSSSVRQPTNNHLCQPSTSPTRSIPAAGFEQPLIRSWNRC